MNRIFRVLLAAALISGCSRIDEELPDSREAAVITSGVQDSASSGAPLSGYVYALLDETERMGYDVIAGAAAEMSDTADLSGFGFDAAQKQKLFTLVYNQEPQFFWLAPIFAADGEILKMSYYFTAEELPGRKAQMEVSAREALGGLQEEGTAYDLLKSFHDYMALNCKFDEEGDYVSTAYGALCDGRAQCQGYALGFAYLCGKAGIDCIVVNGWNSKGDTHAWNKVFINGGWANVDVTWDDPIIQYEDESYYSYNFFLVPDSDILNITHFQDYGYFNPPPCDSGGENYFIKEGLVFDSADEGIEKLKELILTCASGGSREARIRFSNRGAYAEAVGILFDENGIKGIIEDMNGTYGTGIKDLYKHNNDELNIIHISLVLKG